MKTPPREMLMEHLRYDPETGLFWWRLRAPKRKLNRSVGGVTKKGHVVIRCFDLYLRANRLAWLFMTGEWPSRQVDHKNRNPSDNRWSNLRLATNGQNRANSTTNKNNRARLKGVSWHARSGRYQAQISGRYIGLFRTPEQAHAAYVRAAKKQFGEFFHAG